MRNATPAGQASLRLRIGAGSLEESDAQQGLAHLLEHMSFKGSTHVPSGEMVRILQRDGLAFGPDTNASTEWTQTVYMLDLPKADADTLATALMLMRETAGELSLDGGALDAERGVVLSEERLRDTPQYRAEKAQLDLLAHGQLAARRFPIGQVEVIEHAPASLLREFYRANYRPGRATLIAVGDFDPAAMEAQIKARFGDWTPVGPPTDPPSLGEVEARGLTVKVVRLPGSSTQTVIAWARPYDASPDTTVRRRRELVEGLTLAVLNRRLDSLARGERPPFLEAGGAFQNLLRSAKVSIVQAESAPGAWRGALEAIETEARRLVAHGVRQEELDREIVQARAAMRNAAAGASTRPTPELATNLVEAADQEAVFTSPGQDLALFEADVKGLTAADVDAAARAVFAGAGPLVELATPDPVEGGEATLLAEYTKDHAGAATAAAAQVARSWPYASFGPLGAVARRGEIGDLGAWTVRFANGVGLTVKPTAFRKDQVLVAVDVGAGRLDLPRDRPDVAWAAPAVVGGGFGAISLEDSQRVLSGRIYDADFAVGDQAFEFRGATRPQDLATQLQVLTAYVADPGFRPEAFERLRAAYIAGLPQLEATPDGVITRDLAGLLHAGDSRWVFPGPRDLETATPGGLKALLSGPLSTGPIDVTIVGDVDLQAAIDAVAATFGTLPPRPARVLPPAEGLEARFPAPTLMPVERTDTGRADQAVAVIAWPVSDFFADTARARAAMLAGEVLENRILDEVRIVQGATYSPDTQVAPSETFPGYGYGLAMVEMPPAKIPRFFADVAKITADMGSTGVTADELARARNPRVAGIRKAQLTNEYWLTRLAGSIADPRRLSLIRTT
ncbi:MAG: insulinase family protein, partial [Pseudomonadota bacterium]